MSQADRGYVRVAPGGPLDTLRGLHQQEPAPLLAKSLFIGGTLPMSRTILQVLVIAVMLVATAAGAFTPADLTVHDQLAVSFAPQPGPDVVIVDIDDDSLAKHGRWPWPRPTLARLIDAVSRGNPAVIGIDIILSEPDAVADEQLALAVSKAGNVVLPAYVESCRLPKGSAWYTSSAPAVFPLDELSDSAAGIGHVTVLALQGGIARRIPFLLGTGDGLLPAFTAEVVRVGLGLDRDDVSVIPGVRAELGNATAKTAAAHVAPTIPLDSASCLSPSFTLPASPARVSAASLLNSSSVGSIDAASILGGKFVLIGVTAGGVGDRHMTPVSSVAGPMPGVLVHASSINTILRGGFVRPLPAWATLASVALLAILLGIISARLMRARARIALQAALHLVAALGVAMLSAFAYARLHVWIAPVAPIVTCLALMPLQLYFGAVQGRQLGDALKRYTGVESPEMAANQLAAGAQDMAVMFVDLRGWTKASYDMNPADAARMANTYLSAAADAIICAGGRVERFPGDAVMAVFEGHGRADFDLAVRAARAVQRAMCDIEPSSNSVALGVGMGITYGAVARVELGNLHRADLTVVGATVNIAKALEDAAPAGVILAGIPNGWPIPDGCEPWAGTIPKLEPGTMTVCAM